MVSRKSPEFVTNCQRPLAARCSRAAVFPRGQGENDTRKQHYHKKFSYNFVDFFRKVRII